MKALLLKTVKQPSQYGKDFYFAFFKGEDVRYYGIELLFFYRTPLLVFFEDLLELLARKPYPFGHFNAEEAIDRARKEIQYLDHWEEDKRKKVEDRHAQHRCVFGIFAAGEHRGDLGEDDHKDRLR